MSMKKIKRFAVIFLIPLLILQLGFFHTLAADVEGEASDGTVATQEPAPSLDLNCKSAILIEASTGKVLYEQKVGEGIFGGQIVERAPGLTHLGYTLVGESIKQLNLSSNVTSNVINFYYEESIYSIKYVIVGSEGGGGLSIGSENVHAVTGKANGSAPHINKGYKFVGWFLDEACSTPVPTKWVDAETLKLTPESSGVWTANGGRKRQKTPNQPPPLPYPPPVPPYPTPLPYPPP